MTKQDSSNEDMKAMMQTQLRLLELLTTRLAGTGLATPADACTADHIVRNIPDFHHDPDAGVSFESWYKRYEDIFTVELATYDDETRVRLLLRKLGPAEHVRYTNYILPAEPRTLTFTDTVLTLKKIFGQTSSLFNARFNCLQMYKKDTDDFVTYGGLVNRECERFCLGSLTDDQFRCLVFICGLRAPRYEEVRTRLLAKIDQDPNIKLQQLIDECERIANLKKDSALIQQRDRSPQLVRAVSAKRKPTPQSRPSSPRNDQRPPSPCKYCGAWHFHRFCPVRKSRQNQRPQTSHSPGQWRNKGRNHRQPQRKTQYEQTSKQLGHSRSLVAHFHTHDAAPRQFINVQINGAPARLQLDTASDIAIISQRLWKSIGRPTLVHTAHTATSACGGTVKLVAQFKCAMTFRDTTNEGLCYLANTNLNLLGLDWIARLNLLDFPIRTICNQVKSPRVPPDLPKQLIERFADVFQEGLGRCSCTQATLQLISNSQPVFRPKRPVPYAALPLVDEELKRLEKLGIFIPVSCSK